MQKNRRYLVHATFDISAPNMAAAKSRASALLFKVVRPYVRVQDRDSGSTYEHFAYGPWEKVKTT